MDLGKGKKYTPVTPIDEGLTERMAVDEKMKLRGETGQDMGQRPVAKSETVKSDRGSFKCK